MKYSVYDYYDVFIAEVELVSPPQTDDILKFPYPWDADGELNYFSVMRVDGDAIYVD